MPSKKGKARTFGQDIMRGEYVVGDAKKGTRDKLPAGLLYGEIENFDGADRTITGTSIFDPVLCEMVYSWFCPPQGVIFDPFAGGSVRGIVASKLGRQYVGIDLRQEQVDANRVQAKKICDRPQPKWIVGDSADASALAKGVLADLVFSCPPYFDLERYSDDKRDLSTMEYVAFIKAYRTIVLESCRLLKTDRFACFVVGDIRDGKGFYRNFPGETVNAFRAAGLELYNEAILVTAAGSLPLRVTKQFESTRKLGKTHQNILIFVKGDPRKATAAIGKVEFGNVDGVEDAGTEFGEKL